MKHRPFALRYLTYYVDYCGTAAAWFRLVSSRGHQ